jgi:hypothetical protein
MTRFKKFFFSNFVLIVLITLYTISSGFSLLAEHFIGKTSLEYAGWLRVTNVFIDIMLLATGLLTILQIWLRKKVKKWGFSTSIIAILYVADTLALTIMFFFPYELRLAYLLWIKKISIYTFKMNTYMSIGAVIAFGFLLNFLLKKFKKTGKRIEKKFNGNEKKFNNK